MANSPVVTHRNTEYKERVVFDLEDLLLLKKNRKVLLPAVPDKYIWVHELYSETLLNGAPFVSSSEKPFCYIGPVDAAFDTNLLVDGAHLIQGSPTLDELNLAVSSVKTYRMCSWNGEGFAFWDGNTTTVTASVNDLVNKPLVFAVEGDILNTSGGGIQYVRVHEGDEGANYELDDEVMVDTGSADDVNKAYLKVTSVNAGAVTGLEVVKPGAGYSPLIGSGSVTTGGSGTGLKVDILSIIPVNLQYIFHIHYSLLEAN